MLTPEEYRIEAEACLKLARETQQPERHCLSWPPTTWRWQSNRQPKSKKRAASSKLSRGRRELAKQNPAEGCGALPLPE